jgi:hypothetical protein
MSIYLRVFIVLSLSASPAFAYIDPSSSLLLLQGLLAVVGGIIAFMKNPIQSAKQLLARIFGKKDARS